MPKVLLPRWENRSTRTVRLGKRSIYLTVDEATILDLLLEHVGYVVSKDRFLWALYGGQGREEPDGLQSVLPVHISRMRRKGIRIKNRWGAGWYLGTPPADYETGVVYEGKDDIGRVRFLKIYTEATALLISEDGSQEYHVPLSGIRHWNLKPVEA